MFFTVEKCRKRNSVVVADDSMENATELCGTWEIRRKISL